MKLHSLLIFFLLLVTIPSFGQKGYQVSSPDGRLRVDVVVGDSITYTVSHKDEIILSPSAINMHLGDGKSFGIQSKVKQAKTNLVNQEIAAQFYKRNRIKDQYTELVLDFREEFSLIFRAYNEGMAYRFVSTGKKDFMVKNELASFQFPKDYNAYIPYVKSKAKDIEGQYFNSFENIYDHTPLSKMNKDKLAFSPIVIELDGGKKVCLAEADLESYPGMYLINAAASTALNSNFAPYPISSEQGGHNQLQQLVTVREPYIARAKAGMKFPWRIVIISTEDKDLADSDMVYRLAAPSRLKDISWIKPGKVAWEWWNNWGLSCRLCCRNKQRNLYGLYRFCS
jgi:alpha-glucosidase